MADCSEIEEFHAGEHHVLDLAVFERIVDDLAVAALADDLRRAQQPQLVGTRRLIQSQHPCEIPHAHFGDGKRAYDLCARRVRTRAEKFGQHVQSGVARHEVTDEFHGLFVQEGFHTRIIILLRARILTAFARKAHTAAFFAEKTCAGKRPGFMVISLPD